MKVSIIVVCLNPGDLLEKSLEHIKEQTFKDYEIVIKDGVSSDGTPKWLENYLALPENKELASKVNLVIQKDKCIYDAMNQAIEASRGDYLVFMNCGDSFYDKRVLERVFSKDLPLENTIAYGDTYFRKSDSVSKAPTKITGFVCYRNVPCHQSIFYSKDTLKERSFDITYKIRADFEHFIYSYFVGKRNFVYLDTIIADYEGGGFSESAANKKRDKEEYKRAVRSFIPLKERFVYRSILILTLHKLRGVLANSKRFAKTYQKLKGMLYR